ncbi:MAG: hypothetical protein ACRD72_16580 [Candidatus Angelobacter sp.]
MADTKVAPCYNVKRYKIMRAEPSMRSRLLISFAIALGSGGFCWMLLDHFHQGAGDFRWAIEAAQYLLAHLNPYSNSQQLYPLPAALFGLPFVKIPMSLAGGMFYGISSGLLAFALTRHSYHRLLIFFAYPYWAGMLAAQWGPLLMAAAFFPLLLPAALAKPQIGLPVALTHLTRRGLLACLLVALLSFACMPHWLALWLGQLHIYQHFYPLLVLPGPLLALALFRYRDRDAQLFLLTALMPQRWFYDTMILWLIPKSRKEILWTAFLSWGAGLWRWYHIPHSVAQVGRWTLLFLYFPMLAVLLLRPVATPQLPPSRYETSRSRKPLWLA